MHPELLNNSIFLRYYKQWQEDPASIVFAPIAEYFLLYGMVGEALTICQEGLRRYPEFVSGLIVMAKIQLKRGRWEEAEDALRTALAVMPENEVAGELIERVVAARHEEVQAIRSRTTIETRQEGDVEGTVSEDSPSWDTVTMANIYASQGHLERARTIYQTILQADPNNEAARRGLASLSQSEVVIAPSS